MESGPIALISEAGNGLSSKFATILKKVGFTVIVAAKGSSYINLTKHKHDSFKVLEADFTEIEEAQKIYAYLKAHFGKLDVLINNAEMANGFGQKLSELDVSEAKVLFNENVFSTINLSKTLMPILKKSTRARVINITSGLGNISKMMDPRYPYADYKMTAYSMSKAALDMFTVLLEQELRLTNIAVYGFDPIRLENCTYNDVTICKQVGKEFLELISM